MSFNFQAGDRVPAQWAPLGGVNATLNITQHTLDISALLIDCSNSGGGGLRQRIAGLQDVAGTLTAEHDLDFPAYLAVPFIVQGARGLAAFFVSPLRGIIFGAVIEKVHYETAKETSVRYSFDVKLDGRSGPIIYPVS